MEFPNVKTRSEQCKQAQSKSARERARESTKESTRESTRDSPRESARESTRESTNMANAMPPYLTSSLSDFASSLMFSWSVVTACAPPP